MRWTTILIGILALGACLVAPAAAATPLVADSTYCAGNGGAFTVACIQAAVTEAMFSPTFDMVQLETGVYASPLHRFCYAWVAAHACGLLCRMSRWRLDCLALRCFFFFFFFFFPFWWSQVLIPFPPQLPPE